MTADTENSTKPENGPETTDSPEGPSVDEAHNEVDEDYEEPVDEGGADLDEDYGFGEYDTNIVTLSDTETDGVPTEEILERYDEGDVDAFVYNGDASKKMEKESGMVDPEVYAEQLNDTYDCLSTIQEELSTDVLVEPGNHEPIKEAHTGDSEYVEEVESILSEEYEELADSEENAYEFLVEEYDLTNIEYDSVDVGDLTVVGGTHSDGEMDKLLEKEWFEEAPDLEELGYSEEQLEDLAENMGDSGGLFSKILSVLTLGMYGNGSNVDPEDISLEDIPENYEEMTEDHEAYEEALELLEYFEEAIAEADNDVLIAHHGAPSSTGNKFNSKVTDYLAEEYSDEIAGVTGGHSGNAGVLEGEDHATKVNTNGGAIAELGYEDGDLIAEDMYNMNSEEPAEPEEGPEEQDQPSPEEQLENVNQQMHQIEEEGGVEEFLPEPEEILPEGAPEEECQKVEEKLEQDKEIMGAMYDEYEENGEFESLENVQQIQMEQMIGNGEDGSVSMEDNPGPDSPEEGEAQEAQAAS